MATAIQAFRIAASDAALYDLKRRLRATRWPEREAVDGWSQGIPRARTTWASARPAVPPSPRGGQR